MIAFIGLRRFLTTGRVYLTLPITAMLALLSLAHPALTQSVAENETITVTRALDDLERRWAANNGSLSRTDLNVWAKRAAGTGDLHVILKFYQLFATMAEQDGDRLAEVDGRQHIAFLRHQIDGALTSTAARANFELGNSFVGLDGFRDEQQFALMNGLSVVDAFVRAGVREAEILALQAWLNARLGTNLLRSGWPAPALYYLRLAVAQADAADFSEPNKVSLNNLLKQAQAGANAIPPLNDDIACDDSSDEDQQRRDACLSHADASWSKGDLLRAEEILLRLSGPITCKGFSEARQEIVRRVVLLRALRERPGQPALSAAVCAVANYVAGRAVNAASILAMPTIQAYIDRAPFNAEIADLAAIMASRWMRIRNDQFAWLFLESLLKFLLDSRTKRNAA